MTKYILALTWLLITLTTKGQNNLDFIGKWKVVSATSNDFYFNFKTDSSSLSDEMRSLYPDSIDQQKLILNTKNIYGSSQFQFEKNGIYKQFMDTFFVFEGKYRIVPSESVFILTTKNSLGQDIDEKVKYSFQAGMLIISMKMDDENLDFILERI